MYEPRVLDQIRQHAQKAWPDECCGVVVDGGVRAGRNLRRGAAFELDAATLIRAHGRILGVYHSHCGAPASMSAADREHARWWPAVDHVVVRVDDGLAGTIRCHGHDGALRWTSV